MSNAFRTLMVPASMAATALAITNALGAGLERPNITYTAIPSDAEIEAM